MLQFYKLSLKISWAQISQSVPLCQWGCKLNIRWIVLWSFDICMYTHTHTHTHIPTSFALSGTGRQAKYTRVQRLRGEGNNDRRQRRKKSIGISDGSRDETPLPVASCHSWQLWCCPGVVFIEIDPSSKASAGSKTERERRRRLDSRQGNQKQQIYNNNNGNESNICAH